MPALEVKTATSTPAPASTVDRHGEIKSLTRDFMVAETVAKKPFDSFRTHVRNGDPADTLEEVAQAVSKAAKAINRLQEIASTDPTFRTSFQVRKGADVESRSLSAAQIVSHLLDMDGDGKRFLRKSLA